MSFGEDFFFCYLGDFLLLLVVFVVVSVFQWGIKESQLGFRSKHTFEHIIRPRSHRTEICCRQEQLGIHNASSDKAGE